MLVQRCEFHFLTKMLVQRFALLLTTLGILAYGSQEPLDYNLDGMTSAICPMHTQSGVHEYICIISTLEYIMNVMALHFWVS